MQWIWIEEKKGIKSAIYVGNRAIWPKTTRRGGKKRKG